MTGDASGCLVLHVGSRLVRLRTSGPSISAAEIAPSADGQMDVFFAAGLWLCRLSHRQWMDAKDGDEIMDK